MFITVEIKTDDGALYNIHLAGDLEPKEQMNIDEALKGAIDWVKERVARGLVIPGYNEALFLGSASKLRHIRARYQPEPTESREPEKTDPAPEFNLLGPVEFTEKINYLGNDITVSGLRYGHEEDTGQPLNENNGLYFIYVLLTANGLPVLDVVSREHIPRVIDQAVAAVQNIDPHRCRVMMPPAELTYEQAVEYVEDYLEEIRKEQHDARELPPGQKNAKAFKAWKGPS